MTEIIQLLSDGYQSYLAEKVGPKQARNTHPFGRYPYFARACAAVEDLDQTYDCGVSLATGGMWLGYIFAVFGTVPVLTVNMKRRGAGAVWCPIDQLNLQGKRVLVFENDVVTGRTLKRAVRELRLLQPCSLDLLLVYGHTEVTPENYERWRHFLKDDCRITGRNHGDYCLDTMCQVPEGFGRVMSLENDFSPFTGAHQRLINRLAAQAH